MCKQGVFFNGKLMNKLFPFYFVINKELKIGSHGDSLSKLCHIETGDYIFEHLKPQDLSGRIDPLSDFSLCAGKQIELVNIKNNSIILTGEFDHLSETDELLFLGSPAISADLPSGDLIATGDEQEKTLIEDFETNLKGNSQRKKAEEYINSERLSMIAEENVNGILITDRNGKIEWINRAFERSTQYTIEDVRGKRPRHVLYGEKSVHVPESYVDTKVLERTPFTFENIGYKKNGREYWFRAIVHPIIDKDNEITGRFSIVEDITEIKNKELELQESKALWRFALEEAGHGLWSCNLNGGTDFQFSSQFKKIIGYGPDEKFETPDWFASINEEDLAFFINNIFPFLTRESPHFTHEHRIRCKDGITRYFITRGSVTEWSWENKPLKTVGTITDINDLKQKDLELKSASERLSSLIKNLHEGILLEDQNRRIVLVNETFCKMFSIPVTPEELIGADCSEMAELSKNMFVDPDGFTSGLAELLKGKKLVTDQQLLLTDGRILQRDYIPIYTEGNYLGHLWKHKDVTTQIKAENAVLKQKEYYHKILDQIPTDIVLFTSDHKYEFINRTAVKNSETRKWLLDKDDYDYCAHKNMPVNLADNRREVFKNAVKTKTTQKFIEQAVRPDGVLNYTLRAIHPHVNSNGEIEFVVGYGFDITDQINNEKKLETQEKRIRNLLEIINDGVFRCLEDGTVNLFNEAFLRIMDITMSDKMAPVKLNFLELIPSDERLSIMEKIREVMSGGGPQFGLFKLPGNSGNFKFIDYVFTQSVSSADAAFVVRLSDITAIVTKENDLNEIIAREKDLNTSKSRFIHITSHELRTPLSIIQAHAEILNMVLGNIVFDNPAINVKKLLDRIVKEVTLMTEILNQLMTISKIESDKIEITPEKIDISDFLGTIKDDLYAPYHDGRSLNIEINNPSPSFVFDRKLLRMAVINLINNAFKYSANRPAPVIKVITNDNTIQLEVTDYGIGIPEEDVANLFQSFYRASNVGFIQGTGLGLMVVEYAVKKHNGTITFNSQMNKQTTFTITLPNNMETE